MKLVDYDPENDAEEESEGNNNKNNTNNATNNNNEKKKNPATQKGGQQRPFWEVTPGSYSSPITFAPSNTGTEKTKQSHDDILSELGMASSKRR